MVLKEKESRAASLFCDVAGKMGGGRAWPLITQSGVKVWGASVGYKRGVQVRGTSVGYKCGVQVRCANNTSPPSSLRYLGWWTSNGSNSTITLAPDGTVSLTCVLPAGNV